MDPIARMVAAGAAGAGGGDPTYVDDVFSTTLYTSNTSSNFDGTEQVIATGIDHTEGFLTWIKNRDDNSTDHVLFDSERIGTNYKWLYSNDYHGEQDTADIFKSPTTTGFTVKQATSGSGTGRTNPSGSKDMVAWTFRKTPGFFDVVTYTGSGSNRSIAHSLGSVPGCIMIKCTSRAGDDWIVYHRSLGNTKFLNLNQYYGASTDAAAWNSSTPTSSVFYLGTKGQVNTSGQTYVAYIFAHDDQTFGTNSDEAIIKCGSYTGTGTSGLSVDLGFEPQFLLYKNSNQGSAWEMIDVMRGMPNPGAASNTYMKLLRPNTDDAEGTDFSTYPTPTGFKITNNGGSNNGTGNEYIYIAIRRPNKPPTAATEVFALDTYGGISPNPPGFNAGFAVDAALTIETTPGSNTTLNSRLTQGRRLNVNITNAEDDNTIYMFDYQDGWNSSSAVTTDYISYMFRRAPGFFDVVTADYPGISQAIPHNLGVAPELIINKPRDGNIGWMVGSDYLQNTNGWNRYFEINSSSSEGGTSTVWDQTAPTATHFTLGSYPGSSYTGIFYLFASLDGISKVGSYTGTGSNVDVDCGFTAGARFIMIKRTDSSGDWYVWDTLRGIVSGNDPYKRINLTAAQVTNTDYVDPLNAGFTVTSNAPAELNANGGTYLFLAFA